MPWPHVHSSTLQPTSTTMSLPFPPPPPPPPSQQPPSNTHFPSSSTSLPDFLLTALSLFALFTSPKHHHPRKSIYTGNRRFLLRPATTTMSHNHIPNPNPNFASSHPFPNPQSLSDWLRPRLQPDAFAAWGTKPGTKNVHNLWLEIADGETSLVDTTPPVRNLEVLCLRIIGPGDRVLVESHQELSDGSIRHRNRPLSEKLKSGEEIESAVKRAVKEELGSVLCTSGGDDFDKIVKIIPDSYEKKVEQRASVSYPGLPACYVLHTVEVLVEGLPVDGEFVTEEHNEYVDCGVINKNIAMEAVSVKRHFWRWVSKDSL